MRKTLRLRAYILICCLSSTRDRLSIIMAAKLKMSGKHSRRWTKSEINLYAVVLAEPENQFAVSLEKLALKKAANNELFEHIQASFTSKMEGVRIQISRLKNKLIP